MDGITIANDLRRVANQVRQNQNPTASALNAYAHELEGIATRVAAWGTGEPEQARAGGGS